MKGRNPPRAPNSNIIPDPISLTLISRPSRSIMACLSTSWRPVPTPSTAGVVVVGPRSLRTTTIISVARPANPCPRLRRSAICFSRRHATAARPKPDEALLAVIDSEIKSAKDSEDPDQAVKIPNDFPFKIEDRPRQQTIMLTRQYNKEVINVEVSMPDLVPNAQDEVEDDSYDEDNDDEDEESDPDYSIPLIVSVSKADGPSLEFTCAAFSDEIAIDNLSLKYPEEVEDDRVSYEGPEFVDLDENLQKAFLKYLEVRGIKPSISDFLYEYMAAKESREYTRWLNGMRKFIVA